jgi:catechol 2,3-dioxygenase-like lactoylglutathione lyase family enzyme
MFDHLSVSVRDLDRAVAIYAAALAPLGITLLWRTPRAAGFGPAGFTGEAPFALVVPRDGVVATDTATHLAFAAPSREAVQAFHAGAVAAGATDDGPPGVREAYDPGYYAAFFLDADNRRVEAVLHERAG